MTQKEMFGTALWVSGEAAKQQDVFFLRGKFHVQNAKQATLRVIGLGTFHCFLNGVRVGEDRMLPLATEYEARPQYPTGEVLSGHRMYVPEYDITPLLKEGENLIAIHFGGGWYTADHYTTPYGAPKAIWRVFGCGENGDFDFGSSCRDKVAKSYVYAYDFIHRECHDYRICTDAALTCAFDDGAWDSAHLVKEPQTEYFFTDCPADRVSEIISPKVIAKMWETTYDLGKNISGCPILKLKGKAGDVVTVRFSEEVRPTGELDRNYTFDQSATFICSGEEIVAKPLFTWFGFRYFAVQGEHELLGVENLHADIAQTADFTSDHPLLNQIHSLFINTQLANMHAGIPSDCPHYERRGYTGDGQLVCHAAMNILDAKSFYRKWISDICDSQDKLTGHVQYTAPYVKSGGGPGGWGGAIVEVPYEYYRQYGESDILASCYPHMLQYFAYLESHSEHGLVVSDKPGEWCLGDWCTPDAVALPAPFVNTYFYIKHLSRCMEIARVIGKEEDIPTFTSRIEERKNALYRFYYNDWDGNFLGSVQAANAFALDIGLGDQRTYAGLYRRYARLGTFDTGIFGTNLLIRTLFRHKDADLALALITNEGVHSFAEMIKRGATTFWEYFPDSLRERSHNHPMFGAMVGYYYDYLLGIRNESAGYASLLIEPVIPQALHHIKGYRTLPCGRVSVEYKKEQGQLHATVLLPKGQTAIFRYDGKEYPLRAGENSLLL